MANIETVVMVKVLVMMLVMMTLMMQIMMVVHLARKNIREVSCFRVSNSTRASTCD